MVDTSNLNTFTGLVLGVASAATTISAVFLGKLGDRIGYRGSSDRLDGPHGRAVRTAGLCDRRVAVAGIARACRGRPWRRAPNHQRLVSELYQDW